MRNKIECRQLKNSQLVDYNDKIWEITSFTNIPNRNKCSFVLFYHSTKLKKEFVFSKKQFFEINEYGYVVI